MSSPPRRVVITGLGPITAFGVGIDALWENMCAGRSGLTAIEEFDATGFRSQYAGRLTAEQFKVRDAVPKSYRKATKVMARDIELAVGAAAVAVEDAGLVTKAADSDAPPTIPVDRMGCHIGAGLIAADIDEITLALSQSIDDAAEFDFAAWGERGMGQLTPLWLLKYLPNMLACHVTIIHDCQGPSNTITCAESSATLSIGESMRVIQRNAADACLTGGCDSKINPMALLRQQFANRLADTAGIDDPAAVVRPYAADAGGTLVGEGGGILVLESEEVATSRNARIYAEVAGFGAAQSFCRDTVGIEFSPEDRGVESAIRQAIGMAGLDPSDIDAVVPFGAGIPATDQADRNALEAVFGDRLPALPTMLPIPAVGCCGAGAGAIALAVAAKAIETGRLPARVNGGLPEGILAGAADAVDAALDAVLVFTTSLGGQTAAVVLRRHQEDTA